MTPQQNLDTLKSKGLSLLIIKNGETVFESYDPMIKPLYTALQTNPEGMEDAILYDKIIGRAAAYLCILGKVKEIYTPLASETALSLLEEYNIPITAEKTIPVIMNRDNTDKCPMEKMALASKTPEEFLATFQERIKG